MDGYKVLWKNEIIGELIDTIPDMWYLEGTFISNSNSLSNKFSDLVSKFDTKSVMLDPKKGIRAILEDHNLNKIHIAVISLGENNELFVRRVMQTSGIEWLIENVPEDNNYCNG